MKRLIIFLMALVTFALPSTVIADKDGHCNLKNGGKALYHCPEGYEVIIAGEGTDLCDGECYLNGNKASLENAIYNLVIRRSHGTYFQGSKNIRHKDIEKAVKDLQKNTCTTLILDFLPPYLGQKLLICPGRAKR